MPYIALERRRDLCVNVHPVTPGELTYVLSVLADNYLLYHAEDKGDISFRRISEVLGSLEATKLELYRRVIAPYEDGKREQNGEVFIAALEDDDEYVDLDALTTALADISAEFNERAADVPQAIFDHFAKPCDCGCEGLVDSDGQYVDPEDDDSVTYSPHRESLVTGAVTINVYADGAGV